VPSYDANMFTSITEEQLEAFEQDKTSPNVSRCTESYPPGSTYKQVTALALLRSGMSPNKTYSCSGSVAYGGRRMRCTGSHGPLNLW
ncbi:penicillin-binding transpeptidase domain-containing protein, partial [Listeria monocytogenes]|uniref:penicillin-binding transpeptidase domain-containing protein n=1 Tax=Listeria monocytogenes TaxID=1639 RepID=UPI003B433A11